MPTLYKYFRENNGSMLYLQHKLHVRYRERDITEKMAFRASLILSDFVCESDIREVHLHRWII